MKIRSLMLAGAVVLIGCTKQDAPAPPAVAPSIAATQVTSIRQKGTATLIPPNVVVGAEHKVYDLSYPDAPGLDDAQLPSHIEFTTNFTKPFSYHLDGDPSQQPEPVISTPATVRIELKAGSLAKFVTKDSKGNHHVVLSITVDVYDVLGGLNKDTTVEVTNK